MAGTFFGYRELGGTQPRRPGMRPKGSISPVKLSLIIMESIKVPGFGYFARHGYAPTDYPSSWIMLPFQCRMASWTVKGGYVELQVTFDGETVGDQRTLRGAMTTLDCFIGYRVRELVPGFAAWYQLVAII